jgi:hypothetical protein
MFVDLILLWIVNLFAPSEDHCPREEESKFLFGSSRLKNKKESKPINK